MGSFISMVQENEAEGKLKEIYERLNNNVANILKVQSLNPQALDAHLQLYKALMFRPSPLSRAQREMIAVVVSSVNECLYWMEHHGAALHLLTKNEGLVKQLKKDFTQAELSAKDRMMLDYAAMLTRKPTAVTESVLTDLRKAGITDREMLDLCQITAYFNFVNRMAEGLQVELEDEYK